MKVGLWVTLAFVAVSLGGDYLSENTEALEAIGIGEPVQTLVSSALAKVGVGIGAIAMTFGLALPSVQKAQAKEAQVAGMPGQTSKPNA